ncbi:MAG: TraR/DksA C4-type zinc finger protein [Candidatus Dormibacteria bacterium]
MDNDQARQRLEVERTRLQQTKGAADRLSAGAQEAAQTELSSIDQHPAEQATETMERELDMGVAQRVDQELNEVQAALARIAAGTYGRCETCGKAIGDERLEAMPAARFCVEDQAKAEHDPTRRTLA